MKDNYTLYHFPHDKLWNQSFYDSGLDDIFPNFKEGIRKIKSDNGNNVGAVGLYSKNYEPIKVQETSVPFSSDWKDNRGHSERRGLRAALQQLWQKVDSNDIKDIRSPELEDLTKDPKNYQKVLNNTNSTVKMWTERTPCNYGDSPNCETWLGQILPSNSNDNAVGYTTYIPQYTNTTSIKNNILPLARKNILDHSIPINLINTYKNKQDHVLPSFREVQNSFAPRLELQLDINKDLHGHGLTQNPRLFSQPRHNFFKPVNSIQQYDFDKELGWSGLPSNQNRALIQGLGEEGMEEIRPPYLQLHSKRRDSSDEKDARPQSPKSLLLPNSPPETGALGKRKEVVANLSFLPPRQANAGTLLPPPSQSVDKPSQTNPVNIKKTVDLTKKQSTLDKFFVKKKLGGQVNVTRLHRLLSELREMIA